MKDCIERKEVTSEAFGSVLYCNTLGRERLEPAWPQMLLWELIHVSERCIFQWWTVWLQCAAGKTRSSGGKVKCGTQQRAGAREAASDTTGWASEFLLSSPSRVFNRPVTTSTTSHASCAMRESVRPSVCHACESRLNGSTYWNTFCMIVVVERFLVSWGQISQSWI